MCRSARKHLLYLSATALRSLWVGKEVIVGDVLDLERTVVVKGDDPELVELARDWLEGREGSSGIAQYGGVSLEAVLTFQRLLVEHFRNPERTVYVHPDPPDEGVLAHPRLKPLSSFPDPQLG